MKLNLTKYMNINRIEFVITNQCSGKCKHCQSGDEINKKDSHNHVIADKATEIVEKLASVFDITSVMTFGGEPLLYPAIVSNIHKKATECNVKTRQIITNGFFTSNKEASKKVAISLRDAGVNNLLISVDGLHQETIPIKPVKQFIIDVIDAKIPDAYLYPAWVVNESHNNPYNKKTKEILKQLSDLPIPIAGNIVELNGSAANHLTEYYDVSPLSLSDSRLSEPCFSPLAVNTICINPNGDVWSCCGVIGNVYLDDILDIIARYNPNENKCASAIMNGGIIELLTLAEKQGITVDITKYYSICWDLCNSISKCISEK